MVGQELYRAPNGTKVDVFDDKCWVVAEDARETTRYSDVHVGRQLDSIHIGVGATPMLLIIPFQWLQSFLLALGQMRPLSSNLTEPLLTLSEWITRKHFRSTVQLI